MVYADGSYSVIVHGWPEDVDGSARQDDGHVDTLGSKPENLPTMGDSIIAWLKTAETTGKAVGENRSTVSARWDSRRPLVQRR